MPYAGEEPITSFFRPVSSARRRKENSHFHATKAKRSLGTDANQPLTKKPKTQHICDAKQTKDATKLDTSSTIDRMKSDAQRTSNAVQRRTALATFNATEKLITLPVAHYLRTPPPTNSPMKRRTASSTSIYATPCPSTFLPKISSSFTRPLPTPLTISRRVKHSKGTGTRTSVPEFSARGSLTSGTMPTTDREKGSTSGFHDDPFVLPAPFKFSIPSSQSQDGVLDPLLYSPKGSLDLPEPRSRPDLLDRNTTTDVNTTGCPFSVTSLEAFDEYTYVQSSQSQHVLPVYVSPRRNSGNSSYIRSISSHEDSTNPLFEELIPSSQSQTEKELDESSKALDYLPNITALSTSNYETHTQRDLPYPNPDNPIMEGGLFEKDLVATSTCNLPSGSRHPEDSATEDESEDESPRGFDLGQHKDTPTRRFPSGSPVKGVYSLPNIVKDFRDMFEDSNGSYPEDFPMSLR